MTKTRIFVLIALIVVLSVPAWFVYTRFLTDQYHMQGSTLSFNNTLYSRKELWEPSDEQNLGNVIGIAVEGPRTITDLIWPQWVMEYQNDPDHNRVFVRGLMDLGAVYTK